MARTGVGASLASMGMEQKDQAFKMVGEAAKEEESRNKFNEQLEQQRKAGNQQLGGAVGAALGAQYGSALGPWGTIIGGVVGAVAGGLF